MQHAFLVPQNLKFKRWSRYIQLRYFDNSKVHDGFTDMVAGPWASTPVIANPFKRLDSKFSATSKALMGWNDKFIGNVKQQILV
jgi:hypothetical protein